MREKAFITYRLEWLKDQFRLYYLFILAMYVMFILMNTMSEHSSWGTSGLDALTVVFIFTMGVSSFKESFHFSQAHNISRRIFFNSFVKIMVPLSFVVGAWELFINRVYNITNSSPMLVEQVFYGYDFMEGWQPKNDLLTLIEITMYQGSLYFVLLSIGFFFGMLYYIAPNWGKPIVFLSPFMLWVFIANGAMLISERIGNIPAVLLQNVYTSMGTFLCIGTIFLIVSYFLSKNLTAKRGT